MEVRTQSRDVAVTTVPVRMIGLHSRAEVLLAAARREDGEVLELLDEDGGFSLPKYTLPDGRVLVTRLQEMRSERHGRFIFLALQDKDSHWVEETLWSHADMKAFITYELEQLVLT